MAIVSSVKKVRKHMEVIIDGERIHHHHKYLS